MFRLKEDKNLYAPPLVGWWVLAVCLVCLLAGEAWAAGTPAGTPITNTATVTYTLGSDPAPLTAAASDSFEVQEIINISAVWQDAADVPVDSPQAGAVLTFLVTNTGNGPEDIRLLTSDTLGGDDFDPAVQSLWLESNGTAGCQPNDTPYSGVVTLNADQNAVIYVLSNIPGSLSQAQSGRVQLTAEALTAGAAGQPAGTILPNAGWNAVDAVVGLTNADGQAAGVYRVATVTVTLSKSIAAITDTHGGQRPEDNARVTYRIAVDVAGIGTAQSLVITDSIAPEMTYVPESITLDGLARTDAVDGDNADFDAGNAIVSVNLGDIAAPAAFIILFDTTINP